MEKYYNLSSYRKDEIYNKILDLKESGLGYKRIIKRLEKENEVKIALGTLSYWFNKNVKMRGEKNYFYPIESSEVVAHSMNKSLLEYIRNLLFNKFEISSNLCLKGRKGESDSVIYERIISRKNDVYHLTVRKNYVKKYLEDIGFSINRKRNKLNKAIFLLEIYGKHLGAKKWKENYKKIGRKWVKMTN